MWESGNVPFKEISTLYLIINEITGFLILDLSLSFSSLHFLYISVLSFSTYDCLQ